MTPALCFSGRTLALFGLGGSGMASALALRAGGARVIVWDDGAASVEKAQAAGFEAADLHHINWKEIAALILSPGVPLTHPEPHWSVKLAHEAGVEVIGDIEIFCRERARIAPQSPFIAITGTNGKSTTTALIAHLLKAAGRDVALGGNIGTPILALPPPAPNRFHVIEVSSYQIDLAPALAPGIGLLLNLTPDHLDRHGSMDHYAAVKERLVAAADVAVIGIDDRFCEAIALRRAYQGRPTVRISLAGAPEAGIHVRGRGIFARRGHDRKLADLTGIASLRGDHNAQNAAMAVATALQLGLGEAEIQAGLDSFPGLAHRMEEIGRVGSALFINDSKATNADSTQKALECFMGDIFWIAGGRAKAGGIAGLAPFFPRIARAYLMGEAASDFAETLAGKADYALCGTLENAVAMAARDAAARDYAAPVILLSPSCASFDQFSNFEARGQSFRALVEALPGFTPSRAP